MSYNFTRQVGEVKFDKNSYDFERSDAATFSLLKNRFYVPLDSLLLGDSKQILEQHINEQLYGTTFLLSVADIDNSPIEMACRVFPTEDDDIIRMQFCEFSTLNDIRDEANLSLRENHAIIEQFGNIFYRYDVNEGKITIGRYEDTNDEVYCGTLDEFEAEMRTKISESSHEDMAKFVSNIRTGIRSFSASVNLLSQDKTINLTGLAIYNNCSHTKTIGRIGGEAMPLKLLNLYDQLTGVYLKNNIADYARHRIDDLHQRTAIAIIDVDNFKLVNDNYGHQEGDKVLRTIASILTNSCRGLGKVGRIGGDEFFVVYDNFDDIMDIRITLMGIQSAMAEEFDKYRSRGVSVTLSTGCSVYPDDYNGTFEDMFKLADTFLYRAKDKGKDRYIVYNRDKHGPVEQLLKHGFEKVNLDKGEYICRLADSVIRGEVPDIEVILGEIVQYFAAERVVLYNKSDRYVKAQKGEKHFSFDTIRKTIRYLYDENLVKEYKDGYMRINNVDHFEKRAPMVYKLLREQSTFSFLHFVVNAKSGGEYILSLERVNGVSTWNMGDLQYYRIIVKILEEIL